MTDSRDDELFLELVLVFQQSAWMALGKIQNPVTGKVEPSLEAAKHAIDMLGMLQAKTRAALSVQERSFIDNALTQLRLNYVETVQEAVSKAGDTSATPTGSESSPEPPKEP